MKKILKVLLNALSRAILKDPNSTIRVEVTPQVEGMEPFQVDVRPVEARRTSKGTLMCPTARGIIYCPQMTIENAGPGEEFLVQCATTKQGIFDASATRVPV